LKIGCVSKSTSPGSLPLKRSGASWNNNPSITHEWKKTENLKKVERHFINCFWFFKKKRDLNCIPKRLLKYQTNNWTAHLLHHLEGKCERNVSFVVCSKWRQTKLQTF
jgi:hypothetical protein